MFTDQRTPLLESVALTSGLKSSFRRGPIFCSGKISLAALIAAAAFDPEVRQQIEAVVRKYEDAYNKNDAAAIAVLYTADAIEVFEKEAAGGTASGREAIEKRYANHFASNPSKLSLKVVQVYAMGDQVCAISEFSRRFRSGIGYHAKIFVREADDWKIRLAYAD